MDGLRVSLFLIILCSTVYKASLLRSKTACFFGEYFNTTVNATIIVNLTCPNFNLSCNDGKAISDINVFYKSEISRYTDYVCCNYNIRNNAYFNSTHNEAIEGQCENKTSCDIRKYVTEVTGKFTVNYTCSDVPTKTAEDIPPGSEMTTYSVDEINSTLSQLTLESTDITTTTVSTVTSDTNTTTVTNTDWSLTSDDGTTSPAESMTSTDDGMTSEETGSFPVVPVTIVIPSVLVLVYTVTAAILIYFKRKRSWKLKPSVIHRLVSKLTSPRNSHRLSDQEPDGIQRHMSMSDFGQVVTTMTYDDDDDINHAHYDDEVTVITDKHPATRNSQASVSSTTIEMSRTDLNQYVVLRYNNDGSQNDDSYDHIKHTSQFAEYSVVIKKNIAGIRSSLKSPGSITGINVGHTSADAIAPVATESSLDEDKSSTVEVAPTPMFSLCSNEDDYISMQELETASSGDSAEISQSMTNGEIQDGCQPCETESS